MTLLPSPAIPANPSPQLQALFKYAEAMGKPDFDTLELVTTDDYVHYMHPETIGMPHLKGKPAFIGYFKNMMAIYINYTTSVKEIIEAPGKIVFHAIGEGKTTTGFDYKNEHIGIAYTVEQPDGSYKISAMKAFVDSKVTADFMAHLAASGAIPRP